VVVPTPVFIVDYNKTLTVFSSKAKPKRVRFIASDGLSYEFLLKSEAAVDFRKDSRMMDLLTVLNRVFENSENCRDLRFRTYAVVPLTSTSGMIEWIPNLTTTKCDQFVTRFECNFTFSSSLVLGVF
jgi:phosphatidylinositol kinase/protein kinase (PI-3  family)